MEKRSFDAPGRLLARLAPLHPGLTFRAAAALGTLRHRLTRRWPTGEEVAALFPSMRPAAAGRVASEIASLEERNRVLVHAVRRRGIDPFRTFVSSAPSTVSMRGPAILGTFHCGAVHALGPALEQFTTPVLAFRHGLLFEPRPPLQIVSTAGEEHERAAAFRRALAHLQGGGIVVIALDVTSGAPIDVPFLGHTLRMPRGPFALARMSGAPIHPFTGRWTGRGIDVTAAEPLGSSHDEQTLAESAAQWLEAYLRADPTQMTLGLLRAVLYGGIAE